MTRLEKYLLKNPTEPRVAQRQRLYDYCYNDAVVTASIQALEARRRRARRHQRWAIALCLIGSALLLAWEMFNG